MQLLFGFLGLFNLVLFWPGFFLLHATGIETFHAPPLNVLVALTVNGFFGSVISDFLWARSVLLTSPLIATMGLSLTIPLAMGVDVVLHGHVFSALYLLGSGSVISGFVLVNYRYSATLDTELEEQGSQRQQQEGDQQQRRRNGTRRDSQSQLLADQVEEEEEMEQMLGSKEQERTEQDSRTNGRGEELTLDEL